MARWDINVGEVATILTTAGNQSEGYDSDLTKVESAATNAGVALSNSPLVSSRLGEFAEEVAVPHLEKIVGHTSSALQGTGAALYAYDQGDTEMAAEAQRAATQAVYPEDAPGVPEGGH